MPERAANAYIGEVFSSIQGEGIYLGVKQIFVRFMQCSLQCVYCDTPYSRMKDGFCSAEIEPGSGRFSLIANPVDIPTLNKLLRELERKSPGHHSISITGGEPLEQVGFIKEWLEKSKMRVPIYLETNGTLPKALKKIIDLVDIIAMDIKLPSSVRRPINWRDTLEFLKLSTRKNVFVKIVITSRTDRYEVLKSALLVKRVSPKIPFVLQPASQYGVFVDTPQLSMMNELYTECAKILKDVRIIPQVHKLIGVH